MVKSVPELVDDVLCRPAKSEGASSQSQLLASRTAKLMVLGHFLLKVRSMRSAQKARDRCGDTHRSEEAVQWEKAIDSELAVLLSNPGLFDVSSGVLRPNDDQPAEGYPPPGGWHQD